MKTHLLLLVLNRILLPVSSYWWLRYTLLLLIWSTYSFNAPGQTKLWDKTIGGSRNEALQSMVRTPDGGYLLGGSSLSDISADKSQASRGKEDYWVVKLDANGNKLWDKTFGGNNTDLLTALVATPDGYLLGGTSYSGISGDKTQATRDTSENSYNYNRGDYWVVKINLNGEKLWDKCFGSINTDKLEAIVAASGNNFMLGGVSESGTGGDKTGANLGYWIINIDANGNKLWDKTIPNTGYKLLNDMIATPDGGLLLSGGDYEAGYIVKIDNQGNKIWEQFFRDEIDYENYYNIKATVPTPDGGFLLGGDAQSSNAYDPNSEYWVVKINSQGSTQWSKVFKGAEWPLDGSGPLATAVFSDIVVTPDNHFLLAGYTIADKGGAKSEPGNGTFDYWVVKINGQGTKVWDRTIAADSTDQLKAALVTSDGGFLLGGTSSSGKNSHKTQESKGHADYWLVKLDNSGKIKDQYITLKIPDLTTDEPPFAVSVTASSSLPVNLSIVSGPATLNGNILTLTGATGTVTVKATQGGNETYSPVEITKTFRVKMPLALKQWDKVFGGNGADGITAMVATPGGGYLLCGTSSSGISGDKSQASRGASDYWVVKINASGNKEWDKTFGGNANDELAAVITTPDGGYLLGGISNSDVSGDKSQDSQGNADYWVVKIDGSGNKVWDKTFGGNQDGDEESGGENLTALLATADGGYLLGGSVALGHYWLVKINANGNQIWDKEYGGPFDFGPLNFAIVASPDNGYLLGGSSGENGYAEYWAAKIDQDGTKMWEKTYGGYGENYFSALTATTEGYLLGGTASIGFDDCCEGPSGDRSESLKSIMPDYWVIKIDNNGNKIWDKTLGGFGTDRLTSIVAAPDGGYLVGGRSESNFGADRTQTNRGTCSEEECTADYWVIKLDSEGKILWDKSLGGNGNDNLRAIVAVADGFLLGGLAATGSTGGDISEPGKGLSDFWVVKITENIPPPVSSSWNLRYGGSGTDRFTTVIKTADGGYISGGYSNSGISGDKSQAGKGGFDYWIIKTDANGAKLWDKTYGGTGDDYLNRIIPTKDGGYLLAGSSKSNSSGDKSENSHGDQDYWIVKISSSGVKQWDKTFGGSGLDDLRKVNQLADGGYILAGQSNSPLSGDKSQESQGNTDYWIVRIDQSGSKLWDKRYGGTHHDYLETFTKTSDGGFLLAGSSSSGYGGDKTQGNKGSKDYWLVKIDSNGKKLWDKGYGGNDKDELYSIGYNAAGNFFVAGSSTSGVSGDKTQASQGASDYWMLLLNKQGEKLWDKSFGGNGTEELRSIIQTKDQGYILAGSSDSNTTGDKTRNSQGGSDYWIVKTDAQGNKEYDQRYGGSGNEEFRFIQQTEEGGLLLGGRSDSGVSGDRTQPSQGSTDYWLVKVAPLTATTSARLAQANIPLTLNIAVGLTVAPNPFTNKLTTSFTLAEKQDVILNVYDSQGMEVATLYRGEVVTDKKYTFAWLPTARQPQGIYIIRLQYGQAVQSHKVMLTR